ncbi:MAG: hypothetical protein QXE31_01465 [Candidatus Woesearchaeota archaeon]
MNKFFCFFKGKISIKKSNFFLKITKKSNKSQVSIEFLTIFGFVFLMIVPLIIIYFDQLNFLKDSISENQIRNIAIKIVDKAESVYYMGEPSQTKMLVYFPENIDSVNITNNAIMFNYRTQSNLLHTIFFNSKVNLTGSLSPKSGIHKIIIKSQNGVVNIFE